MPEALLTREAAEAAEVAARQIAINGNAMVVLGERLRRRKPAFIATCARGSSDHAMTYGKYLLERTLGLPVASLGPSLASVYREEIDLSGAVFIAASQSGRSPDALQLTETAKRGGALTIGLINDMDSPLAELVDVALPLAAGPETSVAATKSFLATGIALLHLAAAWSCDRNLSDGLVRSPELLRQAGLCDWSPYLMGLKDATSLYVIGRGLGLGIAQEMALKFKETCRIHAEAFSAAEVLHGPLALVGPGFPALVLDPADEGSESTLSVARNFVGLGAEVAYAGTGAAPGIVLPVPAESPPVLMPLLQARAFYGAIAALAAARGLDPDHPPHLRKVTQTL
ncbi:MAG: SIS domain-containing protein [Hyphomicrobiales bacterium]|nr:MAG: SIS domain-containing protein [Hyphomicrobiales bacterium]